MFGQEDVVGCCALSVSNERKPAKVKSTVVIDKIPNAAQLTAGERRVHICVW